jgi:hypothetical protein
VSRGCDGREEEAGGAPESWKMEGRLAGCLRLVVACLELPEREKERRERRLGVEEERIRL